MRIFFTAVLITTGMLNTLAQDQIIPLYQNTPPGNKIPAVEEEWSKSGSGSSVVSKVTIPELWFYRSESGDPKPAIIICPGGGYRYQAYEHEGKQVAQWLSQLGYQAFVLKYRLPDENLFENATSIPLTDARKAISTVRQNAEKLNIDSGKIGIMGFSAGGHLAASASTLFNHDFPFSKAHPSAKPDFSILIYPVISMTDSLTHKGSREALLGKQPESNNIELFSLEWQVEAQTPPTFILHTVDDRSVPAQNTTQYAKALRNHNIQVHEVILPEGGHGFGFRKESPAFEWTVHLKKWLEKLRN